MSLHIVPQSVLNLSKAFEPLGRPQPGATRGAAARLTAGYEPAQHPASALPFSCMSSGRVKARDVEAARRYYVDSV